jgi:hypothetical protein
MNFSEEQIKSFEEERKKYIIPDPSKDLLEIYIQSTIIETLGLRAGKITEKQNDIYSNAVELIQTFLKNKDINSLDILISFCENHTGNTIVPIKCGKYIPDIRQLNSVEHQLGYLLHMIKSDS